jgi:two-component system response regulator
VPKWVALVEDNANDVKVFSDILSQVSPASRLEVFRDGASAYEYFSRYNPNSRNIISLIVMDLQVPRISGVELVNEIKRKPETKSLPIVVVSGTGSPAQLEQLYVFGINSFVSKPSKIETYRQQIGKMLDYWLHVNETPERQVKVQETGSAQSNNLQSKP